jgi:ATP-dependent Clp protease ATP-binding subunit ClpB
MNAQKFTQKSLESVQAAQDMATEYQNNAIDQEHLLYSLLNQEGGLIPQLMTKMNIDCQALSNSVLQKISAMPKVSGSGRAASTVYISQDADKSLVESENQAKNMKDEYVSVEHIFLALIETANKNLKDIFRAFSIDKNKFLSVLMEVRGNTKVTNQNPEDTYDVLAKYGQELVELARNNKLDPVIGRDSEIRNVIRILSRKTKKQPCAYRRTRRGQNRHC